MDRFFAPMLVACLIVAAVLRLGTIDQFSLWLDEVYTIAFASGSLLETLQRCAGDAENLPLYALVINLGLRAGLDLVTIRILPVLAALLSILVFSLWARRLFGTKVAALVALLMSVSPFHLHYSQELRSYPFLLLSLALALLASDRLRCSPSPGNTVALAMVLSAGLYSSLLFSLVILPIIVSQACDLRQASASNRLAWRRLLLALFAASLAFLPWILLVWAGLQERLDRGREQWTLHLLGERWEFLTIAAREGDDLSWTGILLLIVALAGVRRAWQSLPGRIVLLALVFSSMGWEFLLASVNHWSDGRYDMVAWPFLIVVIALGIVEIGSLLRFRLAPIVLVIAIVASMLSACESFLRLGRPSWDRFAEVVELAARDATVPVLSENEWNALCVNFYLRRMGSELRVVDLDGSVDALQRYREEHDEVLLIVGRHPATPLRGEISGRRRLIEHFSTAILYSFQDRSSTWPPPAPLMLSDRLFRDRHRGVGERLRRLLLGAPDVDELRRFEFDGTQELRASEGWSNPEQSQERSFRWTLGPSAKLELHLGDVRERRLEIDWSPYLPASGLQRVRGYLNGELLGEVELVVGAQHLTIKVDADRWQKGRNQLVFQFSAPTRPSERGESADERALSVAFDRLEVIDEPAERQ